MCKWLSMRWHMQDWSHELFGALREAGGTAYSNYAVGYNNVHVPAATENRIAVGNTPGAHSPAFLISISIDILTSCPWCSTAASFCAA